MFGSVDIWVQKNNLPTNSLLTTIADISEIAYAAELGLRPNTETGRITVGSFAHGSGY